ncbi:MAG: U32 family peptidase [Oscillospiraceae bacterium]|nr:U32 family peptidase [Oscillospiraceae bacterium]
MPQLNTAEESRSFYPYQITAPAVGIAGVTAAVQGGADAVYCRVAKSASALETSFSDFRRAVPYAHYRNCKIFADFSGTPTSAGSTRAMQTAAACVRTGADALRVSDFGLLLEMRRSFPQTPIHLTEQFCLRTDEELRFAAGAGSKRITIPTDLSQEQAAPIIASAVALGLETALFAHGNVLPRLIKSAGELTFDPHDLHSINRDGENYVLRLKNRCLLHCMDGLSGITALEVGNFADPPSFIFAAVRCWSNLCRFGVTRPEDIEFLERLSERDRCGFVWDEQETDFFQEHPRAIAHSAVITAEREYTNKENGNVPLDIFCVAERQQTVKIAVSDASGNTAAVDSNTYAEDVMMRGFIEDKTSNAFSDMLAGQDKNEITVRNSLTKQLTQTEGTIFYPRSVKFKLDPGVYTDPDAVLRSLKTAFRVIERRRERAAAARPRVAAYDYAAEKSVYPEAPDKIRYTAYVEKITQVSDAFIKAKPDVIYLPLWETKKTTRLREILRLARENEVVIGISLPQTAALEPFSDGLTALLRLGLTRVSAPGPGAALFARKLGFSVYGGPQMAVASSLAVKAARRLGLSGVCLKYSIPRAAALAVSKDIETEIMAFGRIPEMVIPSAVTSSDILYGHTGESFRILRDGDSGATLFSSKKMFLADRTDETAKTFVPSRGIHFTTESPPECVTVLNRFQGKNDYRPADILRGGFEDADII